MAYSPEQLNWIYDRTAGRCHICRKRLAFGNHGRLGAKAAWEVEHSNPRAKGGSDRLNNLFPACIPCNRSKGTMCSRTARSWHGHARAPLSAGRIRDERDANSLGGGFLAMLIGAAGGPPGMLLGALVGIAIGGDVDPER